MRQVDLDEAIDLNALPRFQRASRHTRSLLILACCLAIAALALLVGARFTPEFWRILLSDQGAALLLLCACVLSAHRVAHWRKRAIHIEAPITQAEQSTRWHRRAWRYIRGKISVALRRVGTRGGVLIFTVLVSSMAVLVIKNAWNWKLSSPAPGPMSNLIGGAVLAGAFGLLVLERYFSGAAEAEWPEALSVARTVRLSILVALVSAVCVFFNAEDRLWPGRALVLIGLLPAMLAAELFLRAALSLFTPRNERLEPGMLADTLTAGFFRWPLRPLHTLQQELQTRFGIDLRQNWAFSFIRRASLPVASSLVLLAWLLTGIHEIRIDGRGIYERFGKPVAVLRPGLHLGLPWPLARVLTVENGVVHELATAVASEVDTFTTLGATPDTDAAEGEPPQRANRLWDASHVAEKSQVIASAAGARQSFHIVNMDVRFIYRIGLTDPAAFAATYNSNDIPALIRSTANRVLVQYFASRSLDEVLGEERAKFADDIGLAVQRDLNGLSCGVEILSTIVEAIHPPAGAANAYHSVQAALISAQTIIARERGAAAEQLNAAQLKASMAQDKAKATARETLAAAEATQLRFAAERNAYQKAGKAFLLEQYFAQLSQSLANSKLVVIDHRIGAGTAPTIDLRTYAAPDVSR